MNEEISRSFAFCDLAISIGGQYWQPLTFLTAGSFVFSKFEKSGQPHPSTLASLMFFFPIMKFLKKHK